VLQTPLLLVRFIPAQEDAGHGGAWRGISRHERGILGASLQFSQVSRGFCVSLRARARRGWALNKIHPYAMSESKRPRQRRFALFLLTKNWNQAEHDDRNPRVLLVEQLTNEDLALHGWLPHTKTIYRKA